MDLSPGEAPAAAAAAWEGQQVKFKENSSHSEGFVPFNGGTEGKSCREMQTQGLKTTQKRGGGIAEGWEIIGDKLRWGILWG